MSIIKFDNKPKSAFNTVQQSLFKVIAVNPSSYMSYNNIELNDDKVLRDNSITLKELSYLLYDSHISSCVQSRKSGVLSMRWQINRGEHETTQGEFIEGILKNLDIRQIISEILDAVLFGYSPLEIYWSYSDGYLIPFDIKGKPAWWFEFRNTGQLIFKNNLYDAQIVPNMKFLIPTYNSSYAKPYGEAILSKCYYPAVFKKGGLQLWAKFIEKYGSPLLVAKSKIAGIDLNDLMKQLNLLSEDGMLATNDNIEVNTLNNNSTSSNQIYQEFIHSLNAEISKVILSQTLTTEQGKTGSYAMSKTHFEVRSDIIEADQIMVERQFNKLIKWIIDINFGSSDTYPEFILYNEKDVDLDLANRDKLLYEAGYEFSIDYMMREYGFKEGDISKKQVAPAPAFSENEFKDSRNYDLSKFDLATQTMIKPVLDGISKGKSFEQIQKELISSYPKLDFSEIENIMYNAMNVLRP